MSDWKEKLAAELKRDWRRTGLLVVLTIVAAVMILRQFTGEASKAQARGTAPADRGKAAVPKQTPAAGPRQDEAAAPSSGSQKVFRFSADLAGLPAGVRRDPFLADLNNFPPDPAARPKEGTPLEVTAKGDGDSETQRRMAAEAIVRAEAAKLQLQSILMGEPPRVMIDKQIYTVGQSVGPFLLTRIQANNVVLEKDGLEVVLKLK